MISKEERKKIGKKNRKSGSEWERIVRAELESNGWIVCKWANNIEFRPEFYCEPLPVLLTSYPPQYRCRRCGNTWFVNTKTPLCKQNGKLITAKSKFNPFKRCMMASGGFPDFIAFRRIIVGNTGIASYELMGVEAKSNGQLDKEEQLKCRWYLENNIFSRILIAQKEKIGKKIIVKYKEI